MAKGEGMHSVIATTISVALLCAVAAVSTAQDDRPKSESAAAPPHGTWEMPGLTLRTREVEPGVLLLKSDLGLVMTRLRDGTATFLPGPDGSIHYVTHKGLLRLGDEQALPWRYGQWLEDYDGIRVLGIDRSGAPWVVAEREVFAHNGRSWNKRLEWDPQWRALSGFTFTDDGGVWAALLDDSTGSGVVEVLRYDDGTWQVDATFPSLRSMAARDVRGLMASYGDDLWLATGDPQHLYHRDDSGWREVDLPGEFAPMQSDGISWATTLSLTPGPGGSIWVGACAEPPVAFCQPGLAHFDGTEWQVWAGDEARGQLPGDGPPLAILPDGSAWWSPGGWGQCSGLVHADGAAEVQRFLEDRCISRLVVTAAGDTWLVAGKKANENSATHWTFVIPAETVMPDR